MSKTKLNSHYKISQLFRERFNYVLEDREYDRKEFISLVGVSAPVVNRALNYGIIPSIRQLIKIANLLNVSMEFLIGETDNEKFYKSESFISFQERLQFLIKEKNTKYSEIAHTMPFTENYFHQWERTNYLPTLEYLIALANHLDVSIDYLLGRTDDRKND